MGYALLRMRSGLHYPWVIVHSSIRPAAGLPWPINSLWELHEAVTLSRARRLIMVRSCVDYS